MLIVFTRYPEPGRTKTRLVPALGADSAASLQRAMTDQILDVAGRLQYKCGIRVEVWFEGGNETYMRDMFGGGVVYRSQGNGDLGQRMRGCFRQHFEAGVERCVVVGSDVPGIDESILSGAYGALDNHDLVVGPADDGGYYLIGMRAPVPDLFENVPWGTDDVLRRTLEIAENLGLSVCTLRTLADVDRPEDLQALEDVWGKARLAEAIRRVSVIIPTLDEFSSIESTLAGLPVDDPTVEVIVVDGGSVDGTAEKAEACGVRVEITQSGRARQMNAGAAVASGSILLFLHADTSLPENFPDLARSTVSLPGVVAGAFRFRLDANGIAYRILERLVNWRSRVLQMPYGDQALFMKARLFRELGGFPDIPVMEDFEMVRRLKRRGRISIAPASAITSARRWQKHGFLNTTIRHQWVIARYCMGVSPHHLTNRRTK